MSIILPQTPPSHHLDLRTYFSKFQACLEAGLPSNPDLPNEVAIDACVKICQALSQKRWQSPLPSVARVMTHGPQ